MVDIEVMKYMVFRIPETLKTQFRIVLMKHHVDVQHTFEAFTEHLIAYDGNGIPKNADTMKLILKRALTLTNGE